MGTMRKNLISANGNGRKSSPLKDVGNSGLAESYGRIDEDFLTEWNGEEKVKRIEQMLKNSPVVGAIRFAVEMSIRGASWTFTNGDESVSTTKPNADEITDPRLQLIADGLNNLEHSWNDHIMEATLAPWYGWAMFTDQYERKDGRLLWRQFKQIGNDTVYRWAYDPPTAPGLSSLIGLFQKPHLYQPMIPLNRMLIYRLRKNKNNPEGESLLRSAWIPYYYVIGLQEIEAIGLERNLAGLPVIYMPMGSNSSDGSDDLDEAKKIVRNIRVDEQGGVVIPPPTGETEAHQWRLELLSPSNGGKAGDTNMIISRYEKRILMSALTQFLMLGMDNVGAMATFEGGNDFFTAAVNAIADMIAETFTKTMIPRKMKYNGMDPEGLKLEHTPVGDIDMGQIVEFIQKAGSSLTWGAEDEVWLRNIARMPERKIEEIQAERDANEQRRAEIAQAMAQNNKDDGEDGQEDDEEETAVDMTINARDLELIREAGQMMGRRHALDLAGKKVRGEVITNYASAPDQQERDKLERKWYRAASRFFDGALKRVETAVKDSE